MSAEERQGRAQPRPVDPDPPTRVASAAPGRTAAFTGPDHAGHGAEAPRAWTPEPDEDTAGRRFRVEVFPRPRRHCHDQADALP